MYFLVCVVNSAHADRALLLSRLQYYFDSRDFNTINLTVLVPKLPYRFHLFGYTNLHGRQGRGGQRFDVRETFSEYRLSNYTLGDQLGVDGLHFFAEANYRSPGRPSIGRAGVGVKRKVEGFALFVDRPPQFTLRLVPLETDGDGGQLSSNYLIPLHQRIHLSGFADYNLASSGSHAWVDEAQLNVKLFDPVSLVLEFRHNGFLAGVPRKRSTGWAPGLRVDLRL